LSYALINIIIFNEPKKEKNSLVHRRQKEGGKYMEEKNKEIRISLSKLLLVVGIILIVICSMVIEIIHLHSKIAQHSEVSGNQILIEEINEISNSNNSNELNEEINTENNERVWTIKGKYCESVEAGDPDSYTFYGNEVICDSIVYTFYGNFEIKGDTIKITYKKAYNKLEQNEDDSELKYRRNEEMTILDDNTLMYGDSKLVRNNSFENITLSGHYAEDGTDVSWEFTKDGRAACCGNVSVTHGEYKTIDENGIEIHYTKNEIWDDDGNVSYEETDSYEYFILPNNKSNDRLYSFNEYTGSFGELTKFGEAVNIEE